MIKRSIFVCCAVVLAWHVMVLHLPRRFYTIPTMERGNRRTAQRFMHDTVPGANVIVGSSMANLLDTKALGPGYVKLTFSGGGPFTGLELIRRSGKQPSVLWIEINCILRNADEDLLDNVATPWRKALRDCSPVFTEEGRPSNYAIALLDRAISKIHKECTSIFAQTPVPEANGPRSLDPAVLDQIMTVNRSELGRPPSDQDLHERVEKLTKYVDEFTQRGCRCVFFEMPIEASLETLAQPAAIRKALSEHFPPGEYHWLDLEPSRPHQTLDGIHLVPAEVNFVIQKIHELEDKLSSASVRFSGVK